ncbi:type VI immunity family protein [Robbsia andropogonis]|uniref:type VI immunity family protein n=1 Tax=Robbsia andropogonis TaxID=28092 RepID=UPI002A6A71B3|nr:type VI immunity family protein [Robbsia andropogonis]
MNLDEVIGELVRSNGGACVLDRIHLPYDRPSAGPAAKFGLGCELYFSEQDSAVARERVKNFLLDYQATFPERVNEFLPMDTRRTVKIRNDLVSKLDAEFKKHPPEAGYSTALYGAVDVGLPSDDVAPYKGSVLAGRPDDARLSFVKAYMPVCDDDSYLHNETLLAGTLRWCAICKPKHGTGGFTFIFASGMAQNTKYALQMMKRFPGFDFIDGVDFTREAGTVHNRIKSINWLTVLGDELVSELGGIGPMRGALEPVCKVHEYPGGVVIQAGEAPQLGDIATNNIPEAYRMVARYTRSVRFEDYRTSLFRVAPGLDRKEETLSWIRRFD